jgi:hypothetical protein
MSSPFGGTAKILRSGEHSEYYLTKSELRIIIANGSTSSCGGCPEPLAMISHVLDIVRRLPAWSGSPRPQYAEHLQRRHVAEVIQEIAPETFVVAKVL